MKNISSILDDKGREILEQTPIETPLIIERPIPLNIRLRNQILEVNRLMRMQEEYETPEDADDFDVDDDGLEFNSQYEVDFDHMNDSATNARIVAHEEAEKVSSSDSAPNVTPVSSPKADDEG